MVNSVSSTDPRARLQKISSDQTGPNPGKTGQVQGAAPAASVDQVELSQAAQALPGGKEVGPPFDLEIVSRIKEQIAEGRYPIDLEAITESLFDSYQDLMS